MDPPVDTQLNRPDLQLPVHDKSQLWGIAEDCLTLAIISRLAYEMKLEGILRAIEVIGDYQGTETVQLVIAGSGPANSEVAEAAMKVNDRTRQLRVILTGELEDPRWLYQRADIVLGMGSSILRAMAFGKPCVVQGESGFWKVVDATSLPDFLFGGWYGVGDGNEEGSRVLEAQLHPLLANGSLRQKLGQFARNVVVERFSLEASGERQEQFYTRVLEPGQGQGEKQLGARYAAATARFTRYKLQRLAARLRGTVAADDFNSTAALRTASRPEQPTVRA